MFSETGVERNRCSAKPCVPGSLPRSGLVPERAPSPYSPVRLGRTPCQQPQLLALVLLKELLTRLQQRGHADIEWGRLRRDLLAVDETELQLEGKRFTVRGELKGDAGKALQAAGVAPPPAVVALAGAAQR